MIFKQLTLYFLIALFSQSILFTHAYAKSNSPNPEVVFETTMGSFSLELYPDKAPLHVANFLKYVDTGFYNNLIFHRVIPNFVIQTGGFEKGMEFRKPGKPVKNESGNRLKNLRGTISMARRMHPDTATSQFYINLKHNPSLDYKGKVQPGYTVFGKTNKGMDVIDKISTVPTTTVERSKNVPTEDIVILSAKRKITSPLKEITSAQNKNTKTLSHDMERFVEGSHYVVLDNPIATRNSEKTEVIQMFSYGCPHCYEFEPQIKQWAMKQKNDIDFWFFPAVWNKPMKLFAQAFYVAIELDVLNKIHLPLFKAVVIEQRNIRDENDLADFFAQHGVDKKDFTKAFNSSVVESQVKESETRIKNYKPSGAPELVINGKYRIDRMRAGGYPQMLEVADFLIDKERGK